MGVLQFNGTNDRLRWTTLASALSNVSDGAWTLAVLLKRGGTGTWDAISYLLSGTGDGTAAAGASLKGSAPVDSIVVDIGAGQTSPSVFTSTTSPYLFVLSKGAGSATPSLTWKLGSAGAWTTESLTGAIADQAAATMLDIGAYQSASDFFVGHIGVVGWWEGEMSTTDKEALDDNWRTSTWYTSAHGTPKFLVELNVAAGSVVDLIGNATGLQAESGGNYPTLDSGETLDSWTFDGTGAPAGLVPNIFDAVTVAENSQGYPAMPLLPNVIEPHVP